MTFHQTIESRTWIDFVTGGKNITNTTAIVECSNNLEVVNRDITTVALSASAELPPPAGQGQSRSQKNEVPAGTAIQNRKSCLRNRKA